MVVRENKKLDEQDKAALDESERARVEEAARLEGITFDKAMERRRGFRYFLRLAKNLEVGPFRPTGYVFQTYSLDDIACDARIPSRKVGYLSSHRRLLPTRLNDGNQI
ncbi:hypothetical protein AAF712_010814 [Marasmius tenuissimus]|uniref:Uncharacterized protein n=1 Tax=Marasmius tenuissimus TaxID=585030 RepID=A0ABR2ZM52_9AGAR